MALSGSDFAGYAALACALYGCAATAPDAPLLELELETRPGYPATTSRLAASLGGSFQKSCHATLVHPSWALTAAHCFSDVAPDARGTLQDFGRGFSVADVALYPGAHASGETRLASGWQRADFVAAHDLALIPLRPPVTEVAPAELWRPREPCTLNGDAGLTGELGVAGEDGEGWTVRAAMVGRVAAATLLGAGHEGWLLAARGPRVGPGDSGSGMTAEWDDLASAAPGCEPLAGNTPAPVLVGVVQDANPADPSAPFGLVPVYDSDHARWLQGELGLTPPAAEAQPPLLPP